MKKDGKYRFSLQFNSDTEEQLQSGELLERMGNKKSHLVIAALNEYIESHPELKNQNCKVEIKLTSAYDQAKIEQMIQNVVEQRLAGMQISGIQDNSKNNQQEALEEDIAKMLDNLDMFQ